MKSIIVFTCALLALAAAAPLEPEPVQVLHEEFTKEPNGSYKLRFETSDGVVREESGVLTEVLNGENKPVQVIVVRGLYTIPDAEGHPQTITYQGNENGFSASGNNIPQAFEVNRR